jgi:protocatechuate 3,4-dioxygenase beta subunit
MMGIPPRRDAKKRALLRCALATLVLVLAPALAGCGGSEPPTSSGSEGGARSASCEPTRPDMLGPFYEPNAPVRTSVGSGYVLAGTVLDAGDCEPVSGARIEFWLANPEGEYDDAHRATVPVGAGGEYRFESNVPVSYGGRPPHIHLRVTAPGYRELVTQHYPDAGQKRANFDLVLEPL